jgi:hypothetical protein
MKKTRLQKHLLGAFATLALASSVSMAQLPLNLYIQPYGTNTGGSGSGNQLNVPFGPTNNIQNWFINNPDITNYQVAFDTNNPPPSSPTGATIGSISNSWTYNGSTNGGTGTTYFDVLDNNFWAGATFNAGAYSNISFDFKYDTNSTITNSTTTNTTQQFNWVIDNHLAPDGGGGSGGAFVATFANSGANASNFDGAWHHVNIPIPNTIPDIAVSKGPGYEWFNAAGTSGTFSFWLANIDLQLNTTPPPPPIVSFTPVVQGLNLWNDKPPNYTRHQVRTDIVGDFNVDWVGHTPVTYTWNLAHAPTNNGAGVNFTITSDTVSSNTFADPDWSATNAFYLTLNEAGGTSVVATVTVKTNQPGNNSTAFAIAHLTNNTPTAVGTWSVTFTNDTDFVLTGPGGTNVAATIPAAYLTQPYTGVSIFLSATANNDNNYGSYADVTTFDVTGVATPIHENFVTQGGISSPFLVLQDQTYGYAPTNAPNMLFITSNDWNWFTWTLPDSGFQPEVRAGLTASTPWVDSPLTNINLFGKTRYTLIKKAYQQASSQQYFGLIQRQFSQLQVILPGETNAPGTPTGKTGTPDPVSFNSPFITFTVNACDATWHIIPGVFDTVTNTSTDVTATSGGPLANGSGTFQTGFDTTGTFTITASDVSNTNILSNTSSSIVVQ